MTFFLILLAALVLTELVAGLRQFRQDRPVATPASHHEWTAGSLPSGPYALRH